MQNSSEVLIKEIFTSIQGEGLDIGKKHLFIRFCRCNLSCEYCDTDFKNGKKYTTDELFNEISGLDYDTISLTGGEPLIEYDFLGYFLEEYKEKLNKNIYLETNGTLYKELARIIDYIDIIAMDIKLKSATKQENSFDINDKFLKAAENKNLFIKIVFDENITQDEIVSCCNLASKYKREIIIQPKMPINKNIDITKIFDDFYKNYKNIRLIPQTHKFMDLR